VLDASVDLELDDAEIDWTDTERDIEAARKKGIEALTKALGSEGVDWDAFEQQL
jgi:hypothetical protein